MGISHQIDSNGFVHVVFDYPEPKVNLLTPDILSYIADLMDKLSQRTDVRGVLFKSAKPGMFVAGMDVDRIAEIHDPVQAAEGARQGQMVFQKIEDLRIPTVVAINGTCLGGGTEMSLACTFRVAGDDKAVRIGLPEVLLGIIPGFGGTQRLPRLTGLPTALDVILTGKQLDAKRARKAGIVDMVVPQAYLEREALKLLTQAAEGSRERLLAKHRRKKKAVERLMEVFAPLRNYALDKARKKTAERVKEQDYPAPFRAIESIAAAITESEQEGYDFEAREIGKLIAGETSKSLMWLFKSQNALKKEVGGVHAVPRKIKRAGVLGAGIMGGGISQLAADKGIPVRLKDINNEAILTALRTADGLWKKKVKRRRMTRREHERRMAYIAPTLSETGFRHLDIVIEAVVERLEIKQAVLAAAEQHLDERAVFASNTSSIPIKDIAARALRPERVVGLHFFNPVHRMPLVEVIAGERSSPEAIATAHQLSIRLGKVPVVVQDGPGFLVNRILMFYLAEAMVLLKEGVKIEDADAAMLAFGMPMGPFELMDAVGLDTGLHVAKVLQSAFGERIGGDDSLMESIVASDRLGQKNGKGFYKYKAGKKTVPDSEIYSLAGSPSPRDIPPETLQERMVLIMVNEAARCLAENVVREARDLDLAMVMGTGFPPFRGGLLRHADTLGVPVVADRLSRLADAHGERFRPADCINEMVRAQTRFHR
ncbi:hypothetical protein ABI59_12730 [Acidobacteria bacterium Mor1]|nr:hypothetical protein ABI59_12730 [Acidobacteria bacterium Mor1]